MSGSKIVFFVNIFGCPKFTFDRISGHFRSIWNFFVLKCLTKWPPAAILDVRNSLSIAFLAISDRYGTLFFVFLTKLPPAAILDVRKSLSIAFLAISDEYGTGGHFGYPKFTFDRISGHFRSICNFFWIFLTIWSPAFFKFFLTMRPFWMSENHFRSHFLHFRSIPNFFLKFLTKWPPAAILDETTMSIIELVRDIWMSNACDKFEALSLNPSKVIALKNENMRRRRRRKLNIPENLHFSGI